MALIDSKQLSKDLSGSFGINTGSFFVSGSDNPTQGSYVLSTSGSINTTGDGRLYEKFQVSKFQFMQSGGKNHAFCLENSFL